MVVRRECSLPSELPGRLRPQAMLSRRDCVKAVRPTLSCRPVNPRTRPCATRVYISGGNPCRSDTSKTRRRERRRTYRDWTSRVVHRRAPSGEAEQLSINIQALPSFEAFGRFVERSNPFAFWIQAARIAWLPWLGATRLMLPRAPITALPKLDQENPD